LPSILPLSGLPIGSLDLTAPDGDPVMPLSLRNRETQKKKARRKIDRIKPSRNQGNSSGIRKQLKKQAGLARARKAKAAASA
jgi:hypothetical protein